MNQYGGNVNYASDFVRWGDSALTGGWAGAGENGNLNFAVISNSCGVKDPFAWQELSDIFAGLHGLGIVMPTAEGSDDVDAPLRGYYFAEAYVNNPGGSIAGAFRSSIGSMPQNDGGPCPVGAPDYTYGGGEGIGECGAQMTMSVDASNYWASYKQLSETWGDVTSDVLDGTGNSYWYYYYQCNYDCNTWPVSQ